MESAPRPQRKRETQALGMRLFSAPLLGSWTCAVTVVVQFTVGMESNTYEFKYKDMNWYELHISLKVTKCKDSRGCFEKEIFKLPTA